MSPKLRVEDLTRIVDGHGPIVEDVTFEVDAAEVLAVVGPSGSGKTTLLRMVNRLDEPTSGRVLLDGRDHRDIDPLELRRRVGFVAQSPAVLEGSVWDNVTAGPRIRDERVDEDRVEAILERFGIADLRNRDAGDLSGGEVQRVALARALVNDPEVFLLDEPTADLDQATEAQVEELVLGLVDDPGLACVAVTHDPDQALRLGDRALHLEKGRVTGRGDPKEVVE